MNDLRFEWDEAKSRRNVRKHGVSFEEESAVFLDEKAIRFYDPIIHATRIASLCWA